ncbi:MAG: PH domain-containing protein [Hyphomicrobiales bacterium]|nr:PH domain-containing protein [Hyphomicrobiales bacterium]MCP5373270.1 PH domain-containing protein [Hyphomicrobiales bacterium]
MTVLHRSTGAILSDLARAIAGGAVCGAVLVLATGPVLTALGALGSAVFLWFAASTVVRGMAVVELSDGALASRSPLGSRHLDWDDLSGLRLRYFATRRDGARGWYSLKLATPSARLTVDSELDGFADVLARAREAAEDNGLALDSTTAFNLQQWGGAGGRAPFRATVPFLGSRP